MQIIFDDIIYSLQKSGGISLYWQMLENSLPVTKRYIYDNCEQNICYRHHENEIKCNSNVTIQRFGNPKLSIDETDPFIFHSSYYRYCKNANAFNITTVHDFTYEHCRNDIKSLAHKIQKKNAVMHSDGVILISNNTLADFKHYYPHYKGLTKVIYHGYDKSVYQFTNQTRNNEILFVGSRVKYKRFDLAVAIVSQFKKLSLTIVGGGDLNKSEIELLEDEIPARYRKIGFVSSEQLVQLYNQSFALAYTSDYEGFGLPIIEAQSCGCPIICQAKSSIPEIAGSYISVDSSNPDTISKNVSTLFDNYEYRRIQQQGLENVKRFGWDKTIQETMSFYEEVYKSKKESR